MILSPAEGEAPTPALTSVIWVSTWLTCFWRDRAMGRRLDGEIERETSTRENGGKSEQNRQQKKELEDTTTEI